jgi:hypothetical protein
MVDLTIDIGSKTPKQSSCDDVGCVLNHNEDCIDDSSVKLNLDNQPNQLPDLESKL